jgi:hypothetical protein
VRHECAFCVDCGRNERPKTIPQRGGASQAETILEGMGSCLDAINRAADAKLKKKLIICRGCMPPELDDQTGSITPK